MIRGETLTDDEVAMIDRVLAAMAQCNAIGVELWRARALAAESKLAAANKAADDLADELLTLHADIAEHLPAYDLGEEGGDLDLANPREVVEYAGDDLRRASKLAAKWRKVEPLIERLLDQMTPERWKAIDGDVGATIDALIAADVTP